VVLELLIQPHILVAIAVIRALIHHDGDALDVKAASTTLRPWKMIGRATLPEASCRFPNQLLRLADVGLLGLLVEQLLDALCNVV